MRHDDTKKGLFVVSVLVLVIMGHLFLAMFTLLQLFLLRYPLVAIQSSSHLILFAFLTISTALKLKKDQSNIYFTKEPRKAGESASSLFYLKTLEETFILRHSIMLYPSTLHPLFSITHQSQ